jgi:hypothetical protein
MLTGALVPRWGTNLPAFRAPVGAPMNATPGGLPP